MEILDRDLLFRNVDGDSELLAEIIAIFRENSEELLGSLQKAVATADADALHRNAHQLKGALANVGACAATEVASELERRGRNQILAGTEDALVQLEREMARLDPELQDLVRRAGG